MGIQGLLEMAISAVFGAAKAASTNNSKKRLPGSGREAGFMIGTARPLGKPDEGAGNQVFLSDSLQSKHTFIAGGSGAGKSTLMRRMRLYAYRRAFATFDIDFLGDSCDSELRSLCAMGADAPDVALIDCRQSAYAAAINVLGGPGTPHARSSSFTKALGEEANGLGVRILFNALGASVALSERGFTVAEFAPLFAQDPGFRRNVIAGLKDDAARAVLEELDRLPPETLRTYWTEIANKLHNFLYDPALRLSLGQTGFPDLGRLLDQPSRATLVALGVARQPAGVLVAKILLAALERHVMARSEIPEEKRQPLRVFIDEASRVAGFGLESLLAEGRRMHCSLIVAMQHTKQAEPALREALRANCSTQIYFAAGGSEATELSSEIVCDLPREKVREILIGLPVGTAFLVRRGMPATVVKMPDSPVPKVPAADLAAFTAAALAKTGLVRSDAEAAMKERAEWIASLRSEPNSPPSVVNVKRPLGREAGDA